MNVLAAFVTAVATDTLLLLLAGASRIVRMIAMLMLAADRRRVSKHAGAWQPSTRWKLELRLSC
jgi:hypothetical protein